MTSYILRRGPQILKVTHDINEAVSRATMQEGRVLMWNRETDASPQWVLSNPIPGAPIWSIEEVDEIHSGPTPPSKVNPSSFFDRLKAWFRFTFYE